MEATITPSVFESLLRARKLSAEQLSVRIGVPEDEIAARVQGELPTTIGFLNKLAAGLAVPRFALFMKQAPELSPPVNDFRARDPLVRPYEPTTLKAMAIARAVQERANNLGHKWLGLGAANITADNVEKAALALRKLLSVSNNDQLKIRDQRKFFYFCAKELRGAEYLFYNFLFQKKMVVDFVYLIHHRRLLV